MNKHVNPAVSAGFHPGIRDQRGAASAKLNFDIPESILAEVVFKWLMAGHGWWVDTSRFQNDRPYAAGLLRNAMESDSGALRNCASRLLIQIRLEAVSDESPLAR